MKLTRHQLPTLAMILIGGSAIFHGPIAQWSDYHDFADQSVILGIPHACDVLSNLGFALIAIWGLLRLASGTMTPTYGAAGYRLFLIALLLTAFGSGWYHLAPDNGRLIWDRLPIALACAGLLAGVRGETHRRPSGVATFWLSLFAVASVGWWHLTEQAGRGDLRPYLLLQIAPLLLVPIWQWIGQAPVAERKAFGGALLLYAIAKWAELNDHQIAAVTAPLTGHTLKHLLAAVAAAVIVGTVTASNRKIR
jgi:hypothetical protein